MNIKKLHKTSKPPMPRRIVSHLQLNTQNAQRYVQGKTKKAAGLFSFNRQLVRLTTSTIYSEEDIKKILQSLSDRILQAKTQFQTMEIAYQEKLFGSFDPKRVNVARKPLEIHLQLASPYSVRTADLIAHYDQILGWMLIAKSVDIDLGEPFVLAKQRLEELLCTVLNLPQQWQIL